MGKHSKNKNSSNYNHRSGWLAGVLHVLNFQLWRTKNRPICWNSPRTNSLVRYDEKNPFPDFKKKDSKMISVVADNNNNNKPTRQLKKMMMTTKQFLEILKKDDVYLKILKDPDSEFGKQLYIKNNPIFSPNSASSSRPARIEHKQKENWYAPKRNAALSTWNVPRVAPSPEPKSKCPSQVVNGFREIKKLLKSALKDQKQTKKKTKYSAVSKDDYWRRYSQLFEQLSSKSLRISDEEKESGSGDDNEPRFFERISSMSSLEVLSSFLTEMPRSTSDIETRKPLDNQDTNFESKKSLLLSETPVITDKEEKNQEEEQRSQDSPNQIVIQQQDQDSFPSTGSLDDTTQKTETLLSQGLGLSPFEIYDYEEEEDEDACFCYVKNVLKLAGFLESKYTGEKWYAEEQPVNPSLLFELEIKEEAMDKVILFDLVNEAIAETHNQSYIYFPKSNIKRFLDEVWGRVEWSISGLGTENRDCSRLIVSRDLRKTDGWMNLQAESEWLTLELEDIIFDELLDELLFV